MARIHPRLDPTCPTVIDSGNHDPRRLIDVADKWKHVDECEQCRQYHARHVNELVDKYTKPQAVPQRILDSTDANVDYAATAKEPKRIKPTAEEMNDMGWEHMLYRMASTVEELGKVEDSILRSVNVLIKNEIKVHHDTVHKRIEILKEDTYGARRTAMGEIVRRWTHLITEAGDHPQHVQGDLDKIIFHAVRSGVFS